MLSHLKIKLLRKNKTKVHLISSINAYKNQFLILNMNDHLQKHPNFNYNFEKYIEEIESVIQIIDFQRIEDIVEYLFFHFKKDLNVKFVTAKFSEVFYFERNGLEIEILSLQSDLILKSKELEEDSWKYVNWEKYPDIKKFFRPEYLFEFVFSYLKLKTSYFSVFTNSHTEDTLRLSLPT